MSELESRIAAIERTVAAIEERNRKVETNKAWETSHFRKIWILLLTYLVTALVFWLIGVERYMLNALIPTLAYWMSTSSVPLARRLWDRGAARESVNLTSDSGP